MSSVAGSVKSAALAGAVFASLEVWTAFAVPAPLDPVPTVATAALSILATAGILGALAGLLALVTPRMAAGLALAVWAGFWGPQQAQNAGWYRVGWCPPVVVAGLTYVSPPMAVAVGALGGAAGALVRPGADAAGLTPMTREHRTGDGQPNILLVTVDGVRKDSLLLHGGRWKANSPFSPMGGWTHFSEAVSPAPWSLPSMHSLMSSMPVREHGGGLPTALGHSRRVNDAVPFAYMLQTVGYETTAIVANGTLSPEHGFADGFDHWMHTDDAVEPLLLLDLYGQARAAMTGEEREIDLTKNDRVVSQGLRTLGEPSKQPRLIWLHLSAPDAVSDIMNGVDSATAYGNGVERRRQQIARLAAAAPGWMVAVVGTHGVSMGEDGRWGFGHGLTDEELRVPMAIRRPGTQGGVVDRQVATADLGHTLLATAGKARHFPGQNLLISRASPVEVGGVRNDGNAFAGRTTRGQYLIRDSGIVGPGVQLSDRSQENLRRTGYLD